jgi:hypothetical protein
MAGPVKTSHPKNGWGMALADSMATDGLLLLRPTPWYDEAHDEPTQPGFTALPFVPAAPAKCECGSGSDALSGAHSHWCRRYLAP